jgi:hypothetical protein
MTSIVILNLAFATFVIVAVVGLLSWSIVRDRDNLALALATDA